MTKRKDPSRVLPAGRPRLDGTRPDAPPVDPLVALQVTVTKGQKDHVDARAKELGISVSELIRIWIDKDRGW